MKLGEKAVFGLAALAVAAAAYASETITYTYDARSRLVRVARSGSVNNNVSANYSAIVNVASPNSPP